MAMMRSALHYAVCCTTLALLGIFAAGAAQPDPELLRRARELFQPLPKDMATAEFPVTKERVQLGRMLFFDPRMTVDANMSCASCHQPAFYGTDALAKPTGVRGRRHPRHTPTVLNAGTSFIIHWRGDRTDLEDQVQQALVSPITSGQEDEKAAADRIAHIPGYEPLFKAAFPNDPQPVSRENIAKAIGSFERTLVTPSPFDAYLKGNINALRPTARAGLARFIEVGCATCHNGVGIGGGMYQKFGVIENYWQVTHSEPIDKGRIDVTKDPADEYLFRVASLRNVAKTPPYFHDGSVATLPEAVQVMGRVQLGVSLSDDDISQIVAFLESLTGDLPPEFATAPVLPTAAAPLAK
jgi:cytochrome c peroxidase